MAGEVELAILLAQILLPDLIGGGGDTTNETINQLPAGDQAIGAPTPQRVGPVTTDVAGNTISGPILGSQQALQQAIQQAVAAGAQTAQTAPEGGELQPVPVPGSEQKEKTVQKTKKTPPSLGDILAAIPEALNSPIVANLLAPKAPPTVIDQRAAPVAGAPPAGLVGNFAGVNQPLDIGRLLAALPGIR